MTRNSLLGIVIVLVSLHCSSASKGTYSAKLADVRDDVRLTLIVEADGSGKLWLMRWFGSKAFQLEHCPVIHAAATVNGRRLTLIQEGGWVPFSSGGPGLFDGTGGYCHDIQYSFPSGTLTGLEGPEMTFIIEDESGSMVMNTPYLADDLSIALVAPTTDTMVPGQTAEVALLPGATAMDISRCNTLYQGQLAHKTLVRQWAGFQVALKDKTNTSKGFSFVVPPTDDSHGRLKLECNGVAAGVARCEGVAGCSVTRARPSHLEVEVSVSASGMPVVSDPTVDPANWATCWLTAELSGNGPDFAPNLDTCSGGLRTGTTTMSLTWGKAADAQRGALRVSDIGDLTVGQEFRAAFELTREGNTWSAPDGACSVTLTQVEIDSRFKLGNIFVVQGTGRCTEPLAPSFANPLTALGVGVFRFRAGVMVSP